MWLLTLKKNRGFSLVELIVVMVIIMISIGGGVLAINAFSSNQKLMSSKSNLVAALKSARQYAKNSQRLSGDTTSVCVTLLANSNNTSVSIVTNEGQVYQTISPFIDPEISLTVDDTLPCFAYFSTKLLKVGSVGTYQLTEASYVTTLRLVSKSAVGVSAPVTVSSIGVIDE